MTLHNRLISTLFRGSAAIVFMTCGLRAQSVRGLVEADATKERLAGGVVTARDAAGNAAAPSAITNANGEFTLRFRSPGRYALSVRRIGYRETSLSIDVGASDTTITVRMSPVPLRLRAIATNSRGQCRLRPTSDAALWAMWSAAELAMLNARVASGTNDYRFDAEFFARTYTISPAKISEISFRDTAIVGTRPWATLPADSLDRAGFVSATETHMSFVGPDLDVLLSPAFLDNHCFSVHHAASGEPSPLVGLDFAPASIIRHIDIRGTFWLDQNTAELRALTFYYDKLPFFGSDTLAGGRIEFEHLSSGAWVLTRWFIRAPLPRQSVLRTIANRATPDAFHAERVVRPSDPQFGSPNAQIIGGTVRAVRSSNAAIVWTAPMSTLTVHVRERRADSSYADAEGAIVRLRGSTRQAVSDKNGDAAFPDMLAGEYIVEAAGSTQDALELPPDRHIVAMNAPAASRIEAQVMSEAVAIRAACGILNDNEGVLSGRILREGLAADDERIDVAANHLVGSNFRLDGIRADSEGRFRACGVPKGETLVASVISYRKVRASAAVTIPSSERFGWVRLDLGPTPPR